MNLAAIRPFPDFPADLARYLFELAAWEDRCTAERLTRVSKLVRQWIDPILYHTVVLHAVPLLVQFHQSITLRDDSAFFARNVKLLRIGNLTNDNFDRVIHGYPFVRQMELVHDVLNVCSGVKRFAFWLNIDACYVQDAFTGISSNRHLTHLSLLDVISNSSLARNYIKFLPPSLTHFHLDFASDPDWRRIPWEIFSEFPQLSHICLSGRITSIFLFFNVLPVLVDAIAVLPHTITAFVVLVDRLLTPDEPLVSRLETLLPAVADRLVIISRNSPSAARIPRLHCFSGDHTVESDWGRGMGMDTWELADICLAKQNQRRQN